MDGGTRRRMQLPQPLALIEVGAWAACACCRIFMAMISARVNSSRHHWNTNRGIADSLLEDPLTSQNGSQRLRQQQISGSTELSCS
jgi:hypothetical protein